MQIFSHSIARELCTHLYCARVETVLNFIVVLKRAYFCRVKYSSRLDATLKRKDSSEDPVPNKKTVGPASMKCSNCCTWEALGSDHGLELHKSKEMRHVPVGEGEMFKHFKMCLS